MSKSVMDFINLAMAIQNSDTLTKKEFTRIRNEGTPEQLEEAVAKMEAAGGYDNLV